MNTQFVLVRAWIKKNFSVLMVGLVIVAVALAQLACRGITASAPIPVFKTPEEAITAGGTTASAPIPVFKTPEEAITSYLEGVAQSDLHKISQACAISEMSEKFKFDLDTDFVGSFSPFQSPYPTDYPFYVETNKMQLSARIFSQVKVLAYSLLSGEKVDGSSIEMDAERVNSFIKDIDPKRLSGLKVKEIGLPNKTLMNSAKYRETAAKFARIYGADEKTERVALFSFEQNYYYLGFTLLRYGENWKISSPTLTASGLTNGASMGAAQKTTIEDFEYMINGK